MENKKNLRVNCALCNIRNITEELLSAYENIRINCAQLVTSPEAQHLIGMHGVQVNCANVISLEENVRLSTVNGSMEMHPSQNIPTEKTLLVVNGSLDIAPGCEELLRSYLHITVNGSVECPRSMAPLLTMMSVNGSTDTYPDGCVRLKNTVVLDRTFHLRAKQDALYYVPGRLIALAEDIDFGALAAKNVRFETEELLVCESQAEAAAALVNEQAEITIVPDGCAYVDDDAELNEALYIRFGGKLFIDGDLTVTADGAPWLEKIEYLHVDGDIEAVRSVLEKLSALNASYDELKVVGGRRIADKASLTVTPALLEQAEDGLDIIDCSTVTFQEDITPALIKEKLVRLVDCNQVICSEEQRTALELIAVDVAYLGPESGRPKEEESSGEDGDTVRINCASYTF